MSSTRSILGRLVGALLESFAGRTSRSSAQRAGRPSASLRVDDGADAPTPRDDQLEPGRAAGSETIRVVPERIARLRLEYAPEKDGDPDAGEVIWTWVPYEENDGRGKDRPVLVIARQSEDRVYAVRMTSKAHDRDRDYLSIGSGGWDSQGRESWVDIEQLYSVHVDGMRREAAILDRNRYDRVAHALIERYGWTAKA